MPKYALYGLIAVCITVLCITLVTRDRLCAVSLRQGNTVMQVTLAYEAQE